MKRKVVIIGGGMAGARGRFRSHADQGASRPVRRDDLPARLAARRQGGERAAAGRADRGARTACLVRLLRKSFELVRAAYGEWHPHKEPGGHRMGARVRDAALYCDRLGRPRGICRHLLARNRWKPWRRGEPLAFWPCVTWLLRVIQQTVPRLKPVDGIGNLEIPLDIVILLENADVNIDGACCARRDVISACMCNSRMASRRRVLGRLASPKPPTSDREAVARLCPLPEARVNPRLGRQKFEIR